jgi:hypothetical protein
MTTTDTQTPTDMQTEREQSVIAGRTAPPKPKSRASKGAAKAAADKTPKQTPKPAPKKAEPKGPSDQSKRAASLSVMIALMGEQMTPEQYAKLQKRFPSLRDVTPTEFNAFVSHRLSYCPPATEWHPALVARTQLSSRQGKSA